MTDKKSNPLVDLAINIIIPSVILMKFSGEDNLGPVNALIIALAFPLGWGGYELIRFRKFNFISALGFISVLLTGGIGLLQLDNQWLAVKEAAIPGIIGLIVFGSTFTPYPIVNKLLLNEAVMNLQLINQQLAERNNTDQFQACLRSANYLFAGTFAFSSVMNFILATWIVTSPAGTEAFNEQLGELQLVSYAMIALPSMVMMFGILFYLWKNIRRLTDLTMDDILNAK